jgi:hypothetical protein
MKITKITVRYGELRPTKEFANKRVEVELSAELGKTENAELVRCKLLKDAIAFVKKAIRPEYMTRWELENEDDIEF